MMMVLMERLFSMLALAKAFVKKNHQIGRLFLPEFRNSVVFLLKISREQV